MRAETREGGVSAYRSSSGPPFSLRPERLLVARFIVFRGRFARAPWAYGISCEPGFIRHSTSVLSFSEKALQFSLA